MRQAIDIMKLYSHGSAKGWNEFLTFSYKHHDIPGLMSVMTRLQVGMADLEKKKLNDEKICIFYLRLIKSIEKTLKQIMKAKDPNPCDNSLIANDWGSKKEEKTKRNQEFEAFLRKSSY